MRVRGRPALGLIAGLFLGFFLALDIVLIGWVTVGSLLVTALPILGAMSGLALGIWGPLGARRQRAHDALPEVEIELDGL
jgi:hypothetical protein